jgi:hypothetical protein
MGRSMGLLKDGGEGLGTDLLTLWRQLKPARRVPRTKDVT